MYWIRFCDFLPHKPKLVDAEAEKECDNFKPASKAKEVKIGG